MQAQECEGEDVASYCDGLTTNPYDVIFMQGPFTDQERADELLSGCDEDCMAQGSQWSSMIRLGYWTMCVMCMQGFLLLFAMLDIRGRIASFYLQLPFAILYLSMFIKTANLRFNHMGDLASLSLAKVFPQQR